MAIKKVSDSPQKRVGIWLRVSTEDQAKGESPLHHEERGRHYADSKSWTVIEVYHLEGVSGKTVMEHPEAKRMLKDIERGHITGLIFSKLARLGRNTRELLEFSDFFERHGADLISLQESIDTSTPAGRLFYTMIAAMAHWEREEIASRVAASIPIRAKLGKSLGGPAPYGYRWVNKQLELHPDESPIRKLAYELFLKHQRRITVARLLNDMGHRGRRGLAFQRQTIECIITDPTAKGMHRANYSKRVGGTKGWDFKPESEWVFNPCPAIVSEELWNRCNSILAEQKAKDKPVAKRAVQLFGGLTWCGLCNSKMYMKSNTPKYVCGKCGNRIAAVDLEDIFIEQLKAYLLSPKEIEGYLERMDEGIGEKVRHLGVLEEERKTVKSQMDQVFELYMDGRMTKEGFGDRYRPFEERMVQLNAKIPELQADLDYLKVNLLSSDEILQQARDLYGHWPTLTPENRHRVVHAIVERITIGKDEIEIDLSYLPTSRSPLDEVPSDPEDESEPSNHKSAPYPLKPINSRSHALDRIRANGETILCDRCWAGSPDRHSRALRRG